MKIFNWLKGLFKSRDKPQNSYYFSGAPFLFGKSISGKTVTETTALQISAVFACCKILAESVACLPLHVYRQDGKGNKTLATEHPLYYLLHDSPNPEMTAYTFKENTMLHLLLNGNAYAQILRDNGGRLVGLYPLIANRMTIQRDDSGELVYTYRPTTGENKHMQKSAEVTLRRQDVLHIPALGFDGIQGYSPIAMARNAIGVAMATEEFGAKFFENGARPSGILKVPHVLKDPQKLSESWQSAYGGKNAGKVAVLEEGVEFQQLSVNQNDAQFLETRKFQIAEIARIFRVPMHMLNELDRATFSNIENQSLEFATYTITPWITRIEQALNKALFTEKERGLFFTKFNMAGILRGDYESRVRGYGQAIQNGWMCPNDVRRLEDMDLIPDEEGGNNFMINGNMTKLNDVGAAYKNKKSGDKDAGVKENTGF